MLSIWEICFLRFKLNHGSPKLIAKIRSCCIGVWKGDFGDNLKHLTFQYLYRVLLRILSCILVVANSEHHTIATKQCSLKSNSNSPLVNHYQLEWSKHPSNWTGM